MAAQDPTIRNIKIKTGVLKRLVKEKVMYEKESCDLEAKLEQMKTEGKDPYDINKQRQVLEESQMMIPDCGRRIKKAFAELQTMLETSKDFEENEDYQKASSLIEEVSPNV